MAIFYFSLFTCEYFAFSFLMMISISASFILLVNNIFQLRNFMLLLVMIVLQKSRLSKSILYDYAVKMKVGMTTYHTSRQEGLFGFYASSVVVNCINYTSNATKTKKDAQQLATNLFHEIY